LQIVSRYGCGGIEVIFTLVLGALSVFMMIKFS
jgi:hypothetical protein